MLAEYLEHLKNLCGHLRREGVVIPVDLDCDAMHVYDQVNVIEQFLYFNRVLQISGSAYQLEDLLGFKDITVDEYLRNLIYEQYQAEWQK